MSFGLLVLGSLIGFAASVAVMTTGAPIWMAIVTWSVIGNSVIFGSLMMHAAQEPAEAKASVRA